MPSQRLNKEEQKHLKPFLFSGVPQTMPHAASLVCLVRKLPDYSQETWQSWESGMSIGQGNR